MSQRLGIFAPNGRDDLEPGGRRARSFDFAQDDT